MKKLIFILFVLSTPVYAAHRCALYEDKQGLPHVHGQTENDAWACMGYLHGRDRAWEMDHFRRIAQGRSAEILGFSALRTDFFMRILGLAERAETLSTRLSPELAAQFRAYADGVNFGMREAMQRPGGKPYEFEKFGYKPERWTVADTISLLLLESFEQTRASFETQLTQVGWMAANPGSPPEAFGSDGLPWDTSILKTGEFAPGPSGSGNPGLPPKTRKLRNPAADFDALSGILPLSPFGGKLRGSNNWVVDGSRSVTGKALLANDPHLTLSHPPFWYHSHISGGNLDVIGASFPGIPQIVSGANQHVAWGLTNSNLSVARLSYVPESDLKNAKTIRPVIFFKFGPIKLPFFIKTFRRTANGWPILPLPSPIGTAIVLRWTAFDITASEFDGLHDLMLSKSAREADQSLAKIGLPSWNFVFADDSGTIGYRAIGRVPRIQGSLPFGIPTERISALGTALNFPDTLAPGEMPHVLQPARGYIATANNRHYPAGMSTDPAWAQMSGFRAFRIEEVLASSAEHDVESFRKLQCDNQGVEARFTLPKLLTHLKAVATSFTPRETKALQALESWDFSTGLDCRACGVYRRWMDHLHDQFSDHANSMYRLAAQAPSALTTFDQALQPSLVAALDDLGVDATASNLPAWGDIHRAYFRHMAGDILLPEQSIPTSGDENAVNVADVHWVKDHYEHFEGASQRLVVELTQPPTVYSILPGPDADGSKPDFSAAGNVWQRWANCELQKREFPVDWAHVPTRELSF